MLLFLQKKLESHFTLIVILSYIFPISLGVGWRIYTQIIYPIKQHRKKKNDSGYIITKNGNYEHREIVEKLIKRNLALGEEVHHINGIKWDNRKINLALMTREQHLKWHLKLEWMWSKKYKTPIKWQRQQLVKNFGAKLF